MAMLQKSLELKPNDQAYSNLGTAYLLKERYREASEAYHKATELNPTDPLLWGNLGHSYRWAGMADQANDAYKRALAGIERQRAVDPNDARLLSRRALYLSGLGEQKRALEGIGEAIRANRGDGLVLFNAAVVYEQSGFRTKAIEALEAALLAGFSLHEINHAPALAALRTDPDARRLLQP
jgi:superkiller protein 3